MEKVILAVLTALGVSTAMPLAHAGVFTDNPYVGLEASLLKDSTKRGDTVEILFSFLPAENIHVTGKPPVVFIPDSSGSSSLAGPPKPVLEESSGFLSVASPVRQVLRLDRSMPLGLHVIKGIVSYYFCSDSGGWCRNFRQHVELPLVVTD